MFNLFFQNLFFLFFLSPAPSDDQYHNDTGQDQQQCNGCNDRPQRNALQQCAACALRVFIVFGPSVKGCACQGDLVSLFRPYDTGRIADQGAELCFPQTSESVSVDYNRHGQVVQGAGV